MAGSPLVQVIEPRLSSHAVCLHLELSSYLHLNPVRAGITARPEGYPYSSFRSFVFPKEETMVFRNLIWDRISRGRRSAPRRYREFVESSLKEKLRSPFEQVYAGVILGGRSFIKGVLQRLKVQNLRKVEISHRRALTSTLSDSDLSRHTVKAHVEAMSIAHAVFLLPPFHGGGRREITQRLKCYSFDTGFVTFVKGWDNIREDDRGLLWEHLVLDTLRTLVDDHHLFYWRDKSGREADFVVKGGRQQSDAIACEINPDHFDPARLTVFRSLYPEGKNYVLSPNIRSSYQRRYGKLKVDFIPIKQIYELKWP